MDIAFEGMIDGVYTGTAEYDINLTGVEDDADAGTIPVIVEWIALDPRRWNKHPCDPAIESFVEDDIAIISVRVVREGNWRAFEHFLMPEKEKGPIATNGCLIDAIKDWCNVNHSYMEEAA